MSVHDIRWRLPGGGECRPEEPWCYAFVASREGVPWPEVEDMIELIDQSYDGEVIQEGYIISLSPGKRFVNRRKLKG